ncbi:type 2 periplasmic-binding domain-containing protein [Nitrospirillum pindoramense]|uniref:Amino acid ABC transporter substrate-binding protein (PAAT family) n=1 Tax=Nitrospirillum amazonense TaxID=28077 RepID=A0A560H8L8_9PROT|nr:hypothetical protein [Nitrospirillum amazonense]TWB42692.1 hypothetical protein FBZ90_106294 [Nitrospirillum amazonense]
MGWKRWPGAVLRMALTIGALMVVGMVASPGRALASGPQPADAPAFFTIVYPRATENATDPRDDYPLGLLRLALDKMGAHYTIRPSALAMEQARAAVALQQGREITLLWNGMSARLERELRPIRIPIYRGVLGYRLFIINRAAQARFSAVRGLEDLKALTAGQALGWPDVDILQAAGLPVEAFRYDLLFRLVGLNRIDYFPRGANEIFAEVAQRAPEVPDLAVEQDLVLVYPFDSFFYTSKANEALASVIEQGLLKAYEDGSYLKYFNDSPYIRQMLTEAHLDTRRRIDIPNPLLSPETAALPDKFWYGRDGR